LRERAAAPTLGTIDQAQTIGLDSSADRAPSLLRRATQRLRQRQLGRLVTSREALFERLQGVPQRMQKLTNEVKLLLELADDYTSGRYRDVRWYSLGVAVAAALYFVSPVDAISDALPGVGQVDDLLVIAIAMRVVKRDLLAYARWRGLDPEEYF
jgi:uncharacterized membrane protein YkvA (DUF1232 family)